MPVPLKKWDSQLNPIAYGLLAEHMFHQQILNNGIGLLVSKGNTALTGTNGNFFPLLNRHYTWNLSGFGTMTSYAINIPSHPPRILRNYGSSTAIIYQRKLKYIRISNTFYVASYLTPLAYTFRMLNSPKVKASTLSFKTVPQHCRNMKLRQKYLGSRWQLCNNLFCQKLTLCQKPYSNLLTI